MRKILFAVSTVLLFTFANSVFSEVQLHSLFTDGMVLQRDAEVPVWGWADDGEKVVVEIQNQRKSTETEDGKWKVSFQNLREGGPYKLTVQGENTVTVSNVMVGEVWVCSGQSNMDWPVAAANNANAEIANAAYPNIRFFKVPRTSTGEPQKTVDANWEVCSPESVGNKSAVGYYFGRTLQQNLDIPIGLIMSAWGGTPAESWTSDVTLRSHPELHMLVERQEQDLQRYKEEVQEYRREFNEWMENAQAAQLAGENIPSPPRMPSDSRIRGWRTSGLYNGMIAPLIPYQIRGAIWYQGESNASRAYQYREIFSTMIQDWRKNWNIGNFSFYWVQLANFNAGGNAEGAWPELREAQNMALELPNTGTAVTIDIGNPNDIHPRNKQEVGRRLALNALARDYGIELNYSGPMYKSMSTKGQSIRIHFDHVDGGLMFAASDAKLQGFTIAGEDQQFVEAEAQIEGNTVVVSCPEISEPVAMRYAWKDNPEEANLYNHAGLPASPFRTDDWPGITVDNR